MLTYFLVNAMTEVALYQTATVEAPPTCSSLAYRPTPHGGRCRCSSLHAAYSYHYCLPRVYYGRLIE